MAGRPAEKKEKPADKDEHGYENCFRQIVETYERKTGKKWDQEAADRLIDRVFGEEPAKPKGGGETYSGNAIINKLKDVEEEYLPSITGYIEGTKRDGMEPAPIKVFGVAFKKVLSYVSKGVSQQKLTAEDADYITEVLGTLGRACATASRQMISGSRSKEMWNERDLSKMKPVSDKDIEDVVDPVAKELADNILSRRVIPEKIARNYSQNAILIEKATAFSTKSPNIPVSYMQNIVNTIGYLMLPRTAGTEDEAPTDQGDLNVITFFDHLLQRMSSLDLLQRMSSLEKDPLHLRVKTD